jgi:hypothetical protein
MARNNVDRKDAGDLSATQLLGCPRFNVLTKKHRYVESPEDYWPRFRGNMTHQMIEDYMQLDDVRELFPEYELPEFIAERRLVVTLPDGSILSGKPDLSFPDMVNGWGQPGMRGLITDWKSTNKRVTSIKEPKPDHIDQVNIYSYLWRNGAFVDTGEVPNLSFTHGQIVYVEMKNYKVFTFPLLSDEEVDIMVEDMVSSNVGHDIDLGFLPPILPSYNGKRNWRCDYCPLRGVCDDYAEQGM